MSDTQVTPGTGADEQDATELSPEEQAAAEALERATQPPVTTKDDAAAQQSGGGPVRESHLAKLAAEERPDVELVDEYAESRESVNSGQATEEDWEKVTEWLLSDEAEVNTRLMRLRVGGSDEEPVKVPWIIRAIGIDTIRSAEREASGNRQARRSGEGYDELRANLRIIVEGTARPDLKRLAREKGLADATILVKRRFQYRPGVIAQVAGEIMALSGFDAEDVQAAGNS